MRIQDTTFVVLDTETTGLDPSEDKVVDISLVEVSRRGIIPLFNTLIHPQRDIPCTASAVHHITLRHVAEKPSFEEIWPTVMEHLKDAIIVAHNAPFDRSMLPETGRPWICSLRLARHIWPDAPAHSNQVLRYWLGLEIEPGQAHSSLADTLVTAEVFKRELGSYRRLTGETDVDGLIDFVNGPIDVRTMPFGKHKGLPTTDLPMDYIDWMLRQSDVDADLRFTLERIRNQNQPAGA